MVLQIVSAFTLFGILQGLSSGLKQVIASTHSDRLYIASSVSVGDPLPLGILEQIRAIPGIREVSPRGQFGGTYRKPDQVVPVIATDPETFFLVYDELSVSPPTAIQTLKNTRAGALVGSDLVKRYGWKIGDRFVLQSPVARRDGSHDWPFDIVGIYSVPADSIDNTNAAIANFAYLNESRAIGQNRAEIFVATVADPANAATVGLAIDNKFANSEHETRTQSEGDLVAAQLQQTVDLDFIVRGIVGAVFFALLLAVGALMMQSLRERIPELAVLKAVGFSDRRVLILVLTEAVVFCLCAAAIGLGIGSALLPLARSQIGITHMPVIVLVLGVAFAVALAVVAGSVPALRGSRLQVAEALSGR
jgi:putative ABC transport system permease protein